MCFPLEVSPQRFRLSLSVPPQAFPALVPWPHLLVLTSVLLLRTGARVMLCSPQGAGPGSGIKIPASSLPRPAGPQAILRPSPDHPFVGLDTGDQDRYSDCSAEAS